MRNLKRALSLTLASVMLLGMMVIGTSAAGYPDVDDSHNVEAIEVLQAVGAMSGSNSGNFNPDAKVSRVEMAIVMANLLDLKVDYFAGQNHFTDVPAWAGNYVAACEANGIISGVGGDKFGTGNVTATQAALMMMKALGYFQYASDFGTDWARATANQAARIRLFEGIDVANNTQLTRNQVAQLALNALKSAVVEPEDNTLHITTPDGTTAVGGKVNYVVLASDKPFAKSISTAEASGTSLSGVHGTVVELGEQLYNGKLELRESASDDFERPARTWVYDGKEVGTYAKKELTKQTYTVGVSCKTLYDLLTRANLVDYDFDYYVDGQLAQADANDILSRSTSNFGATGRGVLTEVFVDHNANNGHGSIVITSIHTWLAQATSDYSATRENINLKVYDDYRANKTQSSVKTVDVDDVPAIEGLKKDQFVLVNMTQKDRTKLEVVAVDNVEIISDTTLTRFSKDSDNDSASDTNEALFKSLTTNGTKYDTSACTYYNDEVLDLYNNKLMTGKTYNVYLDNYDYVIGVDLNAGEDSYVFITGFDVNGSSIASGNAKANAIFTDGTVKTIQVDVSATNDNIKKIDKYVDAGDSNKNNTYFEAWTDTGMAGGGQTYAINRWYTYTEDKGEYTLSPATRMFTTEVVDDDWANGLTIKCNSVRIDENASAGTGNSHVPATAHTGAGLLRAYGNDNSIFIVADLDTVSKSGSDKVITGVDGIYTGVQNVEIEVTMTTDAATALAGTKLHDSIYTLFDKNNYIIASVIVGSAKGGNANLVYVKSAATAEEKIGDDYYWEFDAVVDGQIQTLTVKSKFKKTINNLNPGHIQEVRYDGEYVVFVDDVADEDVYTDYKNRIDGESVYDIGHKENNAIDCWDSAHSGDGRSDDYRLSYNSATAGQKADDLHMIGNTLFLTSAAVTAADRDQGLTFENGAKAVVHQQVNGKWKWQEFDSVDAAIDALGDADKDEDNDKLGFNGRLTAALNSNGTAKWIVIHSDTDVITGTTITTSNKISGVDVMDITPATGADLVASTLVGAAYTLPENSALKAALGMRSNVEDCLFFGFNLSAQQNVTIIIKNTEGKTYSETSTNVTAGNHTLYVDVLGKPVYHSAAATGSLANADGAGQSATKTWPKGEYTWLITGATDGKIAEGSFTIR